MEKIVLRQLRFYLQINKLHNAFQSAYRVGHSTETALLRVVSDLLTSLDDDKVSVLLLLDLSAAFDKIYYQTLFSPLENVFGIRSTVLKWFRSYLTEKETDNLSQLFPVLSITTFVRCSTGFRARADTLCFVHNVSVRHHQQTLCPTSAFC